MEKIFSRLKNSLIKNKLKNKTILISVSSGVDSCVLLHALNFFKEPFKLKLIAAYIHHGDFKNKLFREKAKKFIEKECKKLEISLVTAKSKQNLTSEEDMRDFRYAQILRIAKNKSCDVVAIAHHEDDLLETRIIRLIRGVSTEGLESMTELNGLLWRPFLNTSRNDIEAFAKLKKINFLNDPTNKNTKYFRNWIRFVWLPQLESYRAGSKKAVARSLENLSFKKNFDISHLLSENGISRSDLISISRNEQRRVIAEFLKRQKIKNYTSSQIDEVLKRIDSSRKDLTFKVMGCDWTVDTKHINCRLIYKQ